MEYHLVVATGRLAEIVGEYVKKGHKVYLEGRVVAEEPVEGTGNDGDEPAIFLECFAPVREDLVRGKFEQKTQD